MPLRMRQEALFKNKRVTVFGLGQNSGGVGTAVFLAENGAREIIVTDIKKREELGASLGKLAKYKNITYVLGQHRPEDFIRVDVVVKNPVIRWENEYVKLAVEHRIPVVMDSELFFAACPAPIIGVTGSKGKTTTASLIAHILETAGRHTVRVGIGQTGVLGMLGKITPESSVVFELSSWRLSALPHIKKSPAIAVLTNIYPDHLNYYKTMAAYMADKQNIFAFQKRNDLLIANADNAAVREMAQDAPGRLVWFSESGKVEGDGAWIQDEMIFVRTNGKESVLMPLERVSLLGMHNRANVLAATAATLAVGLSLKQIANGIESFPGVPHRLELVAEHGGVRFFNDTAATIPEAAIAALGSFPQPVILIAGGSDKGLQFGAFATEILSHCKALILFQGDGTERLLRSLKAQLSEADKERVFTVVDSMEQAVETAGRNAVSGDVVLLSPGAASFGLFRNEFDRGDQFRAAVQTLKD